MKRFLCLGAVFSMLIHLSCNQTPVSIDKATIDKIAVMGTGSCAVATAKSTTVSQQFIYKSPADPSSYPHPWIKLSGLAVRVSTDPTGQQPWVVNNAGEIWKYVAGGWENKNLPNGEKAIDIGAGSAAWAATTTGKLYTYSEISLIWNSYSSIANVRRLDVARDGTVWLVFNDGKVSSLLGRPTVRDIPNKKAEDIAATPWDPTYLAYATTTTREIYRFSANTLQWELWKNATSNAVSIDVDKNNNPWIVNSFGKVHEWVPASNQWKIEETIAGTTLKLIASDISCTG